MSGTSTIRAGWARGGIAGAALCLGATAPTAAAAATQAGTVITNTATLSWSSGGAPHSVPSNIVSLTTAERLDVTLVADRTAMPVASSGVVAVGFTVTNTGNGTEDYVPTITSDRPGVTVSQLAIDRDNDGVYDPAHDQRLATDAALALAPGQQLRFFVLLDAAQLTATTTVSASVVARTGSGQPGTVFAGGGDNGGDAVVGSTGATARAATLLTPSAGLPGLIKSQTVVAPDGSARAVRGAIVTYRLVASFPVAARGAAVDDPVPAGTDYVPGSLTLDDRALSDAADTDAGSATPAAIHVTLGDMAAADTRTIQFSVTIQ